MEGSRYLELVERLGVRFRPGGYTPVDIKTTVELVDEVQQAAAAIRELLALVKEGAEVARVHADGSTREDAAEINNFLQKAREATGEAEASSHTQ